MSNGETDGWNFLGWILSSLESCLEGCVICEGLHGRDKMFLGILCFRLQHRAAPFQGTGARVHHLFFAQKRHRIHRFGHLENQGKHLFLNLERGYFHMSSSILCSCFSAWAYSQRLLRAQWIQGLAHVFPGPWGKKRFLPIPKPQQYCASLSPEPKGQ